MNPASNGNSSADESSYSGISSSRSGCGVNRDFLLWSYLGILTKDRFEAIQEVYQDFREAQKHIGAEMLRGLGCRQDTIEKVLIRLEEYDEESYIAQLQKENIQFLSLADPRYPIRLRQIGDPPAFLYARGDLDILMQPCIGVVGTRKMSQYGRRVTEHFVPELVRGGMVTISGMAHGIDTAVAEETLKAGGKTVAILGHGLHHLAPASRKKLADEIVESGGLVLTEFPLDQAADTYTFPARNRIIAGLSLGTLVLEAPEGSGALITANLAQEYAREVFVVPGPIFDDNYAGSNDFISSGYARLVTSPRQVLEDLGIIVPEIGSMSDYTPTNSDEVVLYPLLTTMPQRIDDLVTKSQMTAAQVNATLTMMELNGAVKNVGLGQWVRT